MRCAGSKMGSSPFHSTVTFHEGAAGSLTIRAGAPTAAGSNDEETSAPPLSTFGNLMARARRINVKGTGWGSRLEISYIDRKSTRLNSSHLGISYAVFCLKKKKS